MLVETARRIRSCLAPPDLVARLGGDEFAILLGSGSDAVRVSDDVLVAMRDPFHLWDEDVRLPVTVTVTASIGLAPWTSAASAGMLLRNADLAMYRAKKSGRNQTCVYEPHLHHAAGRRLDLELALRHALDAMTSPWPINRSSTSPPVARSGWRPCCDGLSTGLPCPRSSSSASLRRAD